MFMQKVALFLSTSILITVANAAETGNIRGEVGYVDEKTGVTVESIERGEKTGEYRVLISLPRKGDSPAMEIEEILVTAPEMKPEDAGELNPRYEFVKDYSKDRYGFYVYIGKRKDWPFRIYFKDHDDELIHNR
ncbi:Uncharacterised protein [Zhongshania aliphaticivorans]|uniref:Uncharacterized protein n=1 Tax=Zhongshania aliphaticivorans TaxID=1470434 RepID=A0A5S9P3F0_9GAMM|nr:hypothetical protein [Zhongshania aliphaticivorans]CAA0090373.1 Uncharacterised protein [Zhongshania aliphaticivorans]CAA0097813.1 Uncharacterised protein [Zhongshania aliphaticivorans]